jgi:hypothetical protein
MFSRVRTQGIYTNKVQMYIYFKNGNVFTYFVEDQKKAREHAAKIWESGYRTVIEQRMEWFGPGYIDKICWDVQENDFLGNKYTESEGVK